MRLRWLAVPVVLIAAAACADLSMNPVSRAYDRVVVNPSWSFDIAPVLRQTCGSSGACHGLPTGQRGLVLEGSDAAMYAEIVNVATVFNSGMPLVMPAQPDSSFLLRVLSDTASVRLGYRRMPLTEFPLPQSIRSTIKNWIITGAPDN